MGRTKGTHIRRFAKELVKKFPRGFSASFAENKVKLVRLGLIKESKSELNKLAGELAVEMKKINANERED